MKNFASLQRGGMQVHAVAEQERYVDSTGKRLPWQYERADLPDLSTGRTQVPEKGPFGRSNRRRGTSRSRSKTAEPKREEDRIRAENVAGEDAIFGKLRVEREREKGTDRTDSGTLATKSETKVPTPILLYGFGEDMLWSAVDWYERASNGIILEDYERQPLGKQEPLSRSLSRATAQRSLSKIALQQKNKFQGGRHWIKVTFDSAEAADLAVAYSPHVIRGHLVYAEPFRDAGPPKDEPIFASSAGAQITSDNLPPTFSTNAEQSPTSETVSSATVNGGQEQAPPRFPSFASRNQEVATTSTGLQAADRSSTVQRPARIEGATRAVLLPAEQALLPKQPRASWLVRLGGERDIIGSTVPKREDGVFDWDKAGFYWQFFFWLDKILGTDFCGLRTD